MSRTEQADAILEAFLDTLKAEGAVVESMSKLAGHTSNGELRAVFNHWVVMPATFSL